MQKRAHGELALLISIHKQKENLLRSDLETCIQLLGSTMAVPDDDKFMKLVKKFYDRGNRRGTIEELKVVYRHRNSS